MSSTLAANAGSLDRLKVRMRWGCRRWASQIRCTALRLMPTALATMRPVQCVAALGGSPHGSASTLAMVAGASGVRPGWRVLSRTRPSTPSSAKRCCQRHTAGRLMSRLTRDLDDGQSVRRKQNDPGSLNVLLRTIAVIEDRGKRGPGVGPEEDIDGLCHPTRIAWTGTTCESSV